MFHDSLKSIVSHMSIHAHSLPPFRFTPSSLPCTKKKHSFLCVSVSLVFDGSAQKSAEVPALSTGRRTTSSVISPCCRGTQPRDHWLTCQQYHGWHDKTSDGWHCDTQVLRQRWQPLMDDNTLSQTFFTRRWHMHKSTFLFLRSIDHVCHTHTTHTCTEPIYLSEIVFEAHMHKSSLSHTHTHTSTHTRANTIPSSKSVFSTAHFLPPLSSKNDSGRYFHSLGRKKSRYI